MPGPTHYEILDVSSSASPAEIKMAHRKIVLKLHPDKVADSERAKAADVFQRVQEAYTVLVDQTARERYDSGLLLEKLKLEVEVNRRSHPTPPTASQPSAESPAGEPWWKVSLQASHKSAQAISEDKDPLAREKQKERVRPASYRYQYVRDDDSSSDDEPMRYSNARESAREYIKRSSTRYSRRDASPARRSKPVIPPEIRTAPQRTGSSARTDVKSSRSTETIPLSRPRSSDSPSGAKGKLRTFFQRTPPSSPGPPPSRTTRTNSSPGPSPYASSFVYRTANSPTQPKAHSRRGSGESGGYDVASESKDKARSGSQDSIRAGSANMSYFVPREGSTREGSERGSIGQDKDKLRKMELYARRMLRMLKSLKRTTEKYRELVPKGTTEDEDEKRKDLDQRFEGIVEDIDDVNDTLRRAGVL